MNARKISCIMLALLMLFSFAACAGNEEPAEDTTVLDGSDTTTEEGAEGNGESETETVTDLIPETEVKLPKDEPKFIHPLTGLPTETDISAKRPVSIMVNNLQASLPQSGVYSADILWECLAEGGITRLMMISTEYEKLPKVGSVRSARDYYIDFAQSYDCIFIHAGGSEYAYNTLYARGINRLDGVNGPSPYGVFAREQDRINSGYAIEHTLFLQGGSAIQSGIASQGYRTTRADGYAKPMNFAEWGETVQNAKKATHVGVLVSAQQYVDYVYDEVSKTYLRFQYKGQPHVDSAAKQQLAFKNVIIMYNDSGAISGDDKNRIWMATTGESTGYYITEGTYREIVWKKDYHYSVIKYYYKDTGEEVKLNRGKTMINVVDNYNKANTVFDNKTDSFLKK